MASAADGDRTEFVDSVTPVLDQIGVDLLMLGDNAGDLAALVEVLERVDTLLVDKTGTLLARPRPQPN